MIPKIRLLTACVLTAFLLCNQNVNAEIRKPVYDSTCCAPDSLRFVSINCPIFCVSWRVPSDSLCKQPIGFEVQWKLLAGTVWNDKVITYSSGTTITFCDTVAGMGVHVWRVRTICSDSTYSDWVNGNKFNSPCIGGADRLSISPNPASGNITIRTSLNNSKAARISIVNLAGKNVIEKTANIHNGQLIEELSVSSLQRGIYFVNILVNGVTINRASFMKQ